MSDALARLEEYRVASDEATAGAIAAILDVLTQVCATVGTTVQAVEMLDKCDDLRAADIAALTDRVANLEASRKV